MKNFTVPSEYAELFEKALDVAVELTSFSDTTLGEALNISRFNAAILIGFMEKYEFLYPSAKNEVKTVRISYKEWERIGRKIENYVPAPIEQKASVFVLTPFEKLSLLQKMTIEVFEEGIAISDKGTPHFIPAEEVCVPRFRQARLFKKGYIFFGESVPSKKEMLKNPRAIFFTKRHNDKVDALVSSLISDIEQKIANLSK